MYGCVCVCMCVCLDDERARSEECEGWHELRACHHSPLTAQQQVVVAAAVPVAAGGQELHRLERLVQLAVYLCACECVRMCVGTAYRLDRS